MGIRIIVFLIFFASCFAFEKADDIVKKYGINKNQLVIIGFYTMGNCAKCNVLQDQTFAKISKLNKWKKYTIVAAVKCDREIELNVFKKKEKWKYEMIIDDDELRKALKMKNEVVYLSAIKGTGEVMNLENPTKANIKAFYEFIELNNE